LLGGDLFDQDVAEARGTNEVGLPLGDDAGGDGAAKDEVGVPVRAAGCAGAGG
jgi:hypothetical protein